MGRKKSDGTSDETTGAEETMLGSAHEAAATPARDRLRAFEDRHLGENAHRIDDQVERGVGSQFHKLSDAHKRHYEAIEALVVAEDAVADARAKLAVAEANCADAAAAADRAEADANAPAAE